MWPAMIRGIVILCVFSQATPKMQRFQHQLYISRKSRSNENPMTGFVCNKSGEGHGTITSFDNTYMKPTERYAEITANLNIDKDNVSVRNSTTDSQESSRTRVKDKEAYLSLKQHVEQAKAKTKCGKESPDTMNIHFTTVINTELNRNAMKNMFTPYVADTEFRIDNEDVRTDSRNIYNQWTYSYNGPYDYQIKTANTKNEKAKDKRFLAVYTTVTPIHNNVMESIPAGYISNAPSAREPIIDNPIYGDQPFFSFVLNDYFDKHHDDDPLIFKDFTWGEEFDNGLSSQDAEYNERRSRRLHPSNNPNKIQNTDMSRIYTKTFNKESVTEKAHDSSRKYDKYKKGDDKRNHEGLNHTYKRHRETAFKDFVDLFANKFGSEERNQNSKFMLKKKQDKDEKRKGFKRVYHKDAYQEDNEFYDNTKKDMNTEENGGSKFYIGEVLDSKIFQNNNADKERYKDRDGEINHYRNIAKDAALSNNADYIDGFRI